MLLLLLAIAATFFASASARVFDQLSSAPPEWSLARAANPTDIIKLRVSIKQQNVHHLEQLVLEMSHPDHASYGNHMSAQQVSDLIAPSSETFEIVLTWVKSYNVSEISYNGNWVAFSTDVSTASDMLDADFSWFSHDTSFEESLRTLSYSVPDLIAPHIEFVQPTTHFGILKSFLVQQTEDKAAMSIHSELLSTSVAPRDLPGSAVAPPDDICNTVITPQCLLKLYNVYYAADPDSGSKVSFVSFASSFANYDDLTSFENWTAAYARGRSFNVTSIRGTKDNQTSPGGEANVDVQYITATSYPLPITEFISDGVTGQALLDFVGDVLLLPDGELPQVISFSWGSSEELWPKNIARAICNTFMQLGARGVSVLAASGDFGPGNACPSNSSIPHFQPLFPASCPFVTAVGGTQGVPETSNRMSGGGFSNLFSQPAYQADHVNAYLANNHDFQQLYNTSGRAYPDVSAQSYNFRYLTNGTQSSGSGTSLSAPVFAGIIAMLNAGRLSSGQKTLGFLNPWLYSTGYAGLNDITTGASIGCNNASSVPGSFSFNATCGWDPVTGLGSPDFGKMLALVAPKQCNIGGPMSNPTLSICDVAANSVLSSSLLAARTSCRVTGTFSGTISSSASPSWTTSSASTTTPSTVKTSSSSVSTSAKSSSPTSKVSSTTLSKVTKSSSASGSSSHTTTLLPSTASGSSTSSTSSRPRKTVHVHTTTTDVTTVLEIVTVTASWSDPSTAPEVATTASDPGGYY